MEPEKFDMEALTTRQKEKERSMLLSAAVLLAALLLFSWFQKGGHTAPLQMGEAHFTICADDGTSYQIGYEAVTNVYYAEDVKFGSCIEGTDSRAVRSGLWKNRDWGEYFLCADKSLNSCVVITTERELYAFNCRSDATTRSISQTLKDWITQKQAEN